MNKKIFFLILFSLSVLIARDNPFAPVKKEQIELLHKPIPICDFNKTKPTKIKKTNIQPDIKIAKTIPIETLQPKEIKIIEQKPKPIVAKTIKITPKKIKHRKYKKPIHKARYRQIYKNENLKIALANNHIKIITNDKLLKNWILKNPKRLVLDFGDDFIIYPSYQKTISSRFIKVLKIGTHDCFYRVTLELKNRNRYTIKNTSYGYFITLLP